MQIRFGHLVRYSLGELQQGWRDVLGANPNAKLISIQTETISGMMAVLHLFYSEEVEG